MAGAGTASAQLRIGSTPILLLQATWDRNAAQLHCDRRWRESGRAFASTDQEPQSTERASLFPTPRWRKQKVVPVPGDSAKLQSKESKDQQKFMPCLAVRFSAALRPGPERCETRSATFARTRTEYVDVRAVVFSSCAPTQTIVVSANNSFAERKRRSCFK